MPLLLALALACAAAPHGDGQGDPDPHDEPDEAAVLDALDRSQEHYAELARELWSLAELGYQ